MTLARLPIEAHDRHIAILGKTGSGKTYCARGEVEDLLGRGKRVVVVDPTGVWWGLQLDRDGTRAWTAGFVVIGGDRADIPLEGISGSRLAATIAEVQESFILDASRLTVGARTRLFTEFAEGLAQYNRRELHLVLDEAHLFAPQGRVADPQSGKMVAAANHLVSAGRALGLRIILISQRPAKLHKDSLTQVETLIAMRLIAPQDRGAVEDWIAVAADRVRGREIIASLPSLPTGQGWVWAPELDVLERIEVAPIETFDSMSAPTAGEAPPSKRTTGTWIDIEDLTNRLVPTDKPTAAPGRPPPAKEARAPDSEQLLAAFRTGWDAGYVAGHREAWHAANKRAEVHARSLYDAWESPCIPPPQPEAVGAAAVVRVAVLDEAVIRLPAVDKAPRPRAQPTAPKAPAKANASAAMRLVTAAATAHPHPLTWVQIGALAGLKPTGGHFNSARKAAIDAGHLIHNGERVHVTDDGLAAAGWTGGPPDLPVLFLQALAEPARKMFSSLLYDEAATPFELAERLLMQPRGGYWNSGIATLRRNGLIEEADGLISVARWVR